MNELPETTQTNTLVKAMNLMYKVSIYVYKYISPCCTYVSNVMMSAFADIVVPLVPLYFM